MAGTAVGIVAGTTATAIIGEIRARGFDGPASRARFASASRVLGSARAGSGECAAMMKSLGVAILVPALMLGDAATMRPTVAASMDATRSAERARDVHARRQHLYRDRSAYRPEGQPRYYGRPVYYAPAPFVPLPPLFGYGRKPW